MEPKPLEVCTTKATFTQGKGSIDIARYLIVLGSIFRVLGIYIHIFLFIFQMILNQTGVQMLKGDLVPQIKESKRYCQIRKNETF